MATKSKSSKAAAESTTSKACTATIAVAAFVVGLAGLSVAGLACSQPASSGLRFGLSGSGGKAATAAQCRKHVDRALSEAGVVASSSSGAAQHHKVPVGKALAASFPKEGFRLEHIQVAPGTEDWRLCYPGKDSKQPVCPTADFFVVNQRDGSTDGVVDWLQGAEEHVFDLVSAVISTDLPTGCLRAQGPCITTAGSFTAEERDSGKLFFLDIGANHAFYSLMASSAAPFLTTIAFEPQPHCAAFIQLALEASGLQERMMVLNNLAGTTALAAPPAGSSDAGAHYGRFYVPPKSQASVAIPRRTGCRGTWPTLLENERAAVAQAYKDFPAALQETPIGYVDPGSLLPPGHFVLFAKVDVEGFEEEVTDSLAPLLEGKRVFNILMELNKPQKARRLGRPDPNDLNDAMVVEWVVKMLGRLQGYGYTIVPQWGGYKTQEVLKSDKDSLLTFAKAGWNSVDILAYIPRDEAAAAPAPASSSKKSKGKKAKKQAAAE